MTNYFFPIQKLSDWFLNHQRQLPWRDTSDPYAIWISEVMLQQTQVAAVLPFYKRWMKRFPNLEALAEAPLEEVIKYWEGLGYYSRARNLHFGAQEILSRFGGHFPSSTKDLLSIKGIGPYTKGAIQSFAFKLRSVLIDGNVKRVIARFFGLHLDFSVPKNHKKLEDLLETVLPFEKPWIFNEALMEIGALICTPKKALCKECPLQEDCAAKQKDEVKLLPVKVKRKKRVLLYRVVFILRYQGKLLVTRGEKGVMQDLYEFPYVETEHKNPQDIEDSGILSTFIKNSFRSSKRLPKVTHGFTHHHVTLFPFEVHLEKPLNLLNYKWLDSHELQTKPFSSGHRKILKSINLTTESLF